jgi:hypothetical protein
MAAIGLIDPAKDHLPSAAEAAVVRCQEQKLHESEDLFARESIGIR